MGTAAYNVDIKSAGTPVDCDDISFKRIGGKTANVYKAPEGHFPLDVSAPPKVYYQAEGELVLLVETVDYIVVYATGLIGLTENLATPPRDPVAENPAQLIVSCRVIPLISVAGAKSYSLDLGSAILDDTSFEKARANGGFHTRLYGMHDVSLSISSHTATDSARFIADMKERKPLFIQITPAAGGLISGWFVPESDNSSGDVSDLEMSELSFQLSGTAEQNFSWT